MTLIDVNFYASSLGMCTGATVLLPKEPRECAVLYLLHGASDDHTIWLRRTSLERYLGERNLCVIMPEAELSSYEDMLHGGKYFTYITEELPRIMQGFFPISKDPGKRYAAGLSMGGFGALKMGLICPERYAAIGIFSSGNLFYRAEGKSQVSPRRKSGGVSITEAVFGTADRSAMRGTEKDPFVHAVKHMAEGKAFPRFFHVCGTEDFLLDSALITRDWFLNHPQIPYTYYEDEGAHTWAFWDTWIERFLRWL